MAYILYTGWAKKRGHRLMTIILSIPNRFKIIFTGRFLGKFAVKWMSKIPPHLATLPCETVMSTKQATMISTSTRPIFTKFAGLVEVRPWMNDLKLFFDSSRDVAVATNFVGKIDLLVVHMTFARAALPAYDKKDNC